MGRGGFWCEWMEGRVGIVKVGKKYGQSCGSWE